MAETQEPEALSEIEIDDLDGVAGGGLIPLGLDGGPPDEGGGHDLQVGRK